MKLFGFNRERKKSKFQITEADRTWVEDNFIWLIQSYGRPGKKNKQVLIGEKFFPNSYSTDNLKIENLIEDLCILLDIAPSKIQFELHKDLRDIYGMPYEAEGHQFEADTEIIDSNNYKLHIANSMKTKPNRLLFSLIYEFIKTF